MGINRFRMLLMMGLAETKEAGSGAVPNWAAFVANTASKVSPEPDFGLSSPRAISLPPNSPQQSFFPR